MGSLVQVYDGNYMFTQRGDSLAIESRGTDIDICPITLNEKLGSRNKLPIHDSKQPHPDVDNGVIPAIDVSLLCQTYKIVAAIPLNGLKMVVARRLHGPLKNC